MIPSQNLIQDLGIPLQDVANLNPLTPAQQVYDQASPILVLIFNALSLGTYKSPGYPMASDPLAFENLKLADEAAAVTIAMQAAENSGNLPQFHADLDQLNEAHAGMGMAAVTGPAEITVLCNAPGLTGELADYVRDAIAEGKTLFTDLVATGKVIAAAQAGSAPPPQPTVTIQVGQPNTPAPAPFGTVIQDPGGNAWKLINTPFGIYWIRV